MSVATPIEDDQGGVRAGGVVVAKAAYPKMVQGRRDFMTYRELGVTEASEGKFRAQVTSSSQGLSEPTGWHVHICEGQFVYRRHHQVNVDGRGNTCLTQSTAYHRTDGQIRYVVIVHHVEMNHVRTCSKDILHLLS